MYQSIIMIFIQGLQKGFPIISNYQQLLNLFWSIMYLYLLHFSGNFWQENQEFKFPFLLIYYLFIRNVAMKLNVVLSYFWIIVLFFYLYVFLPFFLSHINCFEFVSPLWIFRLKTIETKAIFKFLHNFRRFEYSSFALMIPAW